MYHHMYIVEFFVLLLEEAKTTTLGIVSSHFFSRIRNAYPAFDLKTNTGKIWSITTRFPEHILGATKFRLSIWTDFSPHPLLLTQHGKWSRLCTGEENQA